MFQSGIKPATFRVVAQCLNKMRYCLLLRKYVQSRNISISAIDKSAKNLTEFLLNKTLFVAVLSSLPENFTFC
jgi:hypothetical protein